MTLPYCVLWMQNPLPPSFSFFLEIGGGGAGIKRAVVLTHVGAMQATSTSVLLPSVCAAHYDLPAAAEMGPHQRVRTIIM